VSWAEWITSYRVSFPEIGALLIGVKDDNAILIGSIMDDIHNNLWPILMYNLFMIALAALIGFTLKRIVRRFRLDRKFDFFRFNNKWYYLLSGEILDFSTNNLVSDRITVIALDILCKVGNENIIYMGQLAKYYLTSNGDLDAVLIRYPIRRKLEDDDKLDDGARDETVYYEIPSDYLYVPYRDVINLNINYFDLTNINTVKK
jgi:hypothetical protein